MKIELKNVKHSRSLSEETNAFTATVYVNGKRAATASNCGRGGMTNVRFDDRSLENEIHNYFKSLPEEETKYGFSIQPTIDGKVDDLVSEDLKMKEIKKLLTSGVVVIEDNNLYHYKYNKCIRGNKTPMVKEQLKADIKRKSPNCVIVNELENNKMMEVIENSGIFG